MGFFPAARCSNSEIAALSRARLFTNAFHSVPKPLTFKVNFGLTAEFSGERSESAGTRVRLAGRCQGDAAMLMLCPGSLGTPPRKLEERS
jgi:hypothetical protein